MHNRHNTTNCSYITHTYSHAQTYWHSWFYFILQQDAVTDGEKKHTHQKHSGPLSTVIVLIIFVEYDHSDTVNTQFMDRHILKFLHV